MRYTSYAYSVVKVDIVALDPCEVRTFDHATVGNCIGTIYTSGGFTTGDERSWTPVEADHVFRLFTAWETWQEGSRPPRAAIRAGPAGVRWICLTRVLDEAGETIDVEVEHHHITDSFTLPAGWGFVVASGNVVLEGQAGEEGNYFRPREADAEVTGAGDLLLVRVQ